MSQRELQPQAYTDVTGGFTAGRIGRHRTKKQSEEQGAGELILNGEMRYGQRHGENEVQRARAVRQHEESQAIDVRGCPASELESSYRIQNEAHSRASNGLRHDSGNAGGQRHEPNNLLQGDLDARRSILDNGCYYIIVVTPTPGHLSIRARGPMN